MTSPREPFVDGPRPPDGERIYDDNGVDRTLVRWMLSLTPTERLAAVQSGIDLLASVRNVRPGSR